MLQLLLLVLTVLTVLLALLCRWSLLIQCVGENLIVVNQHDAQQDGEYVRVRVCHLESTTVKMLTIKPDLHYCTWSVSGRGGGPLSMVV